MNTRSKLYYIAPLIVLAGHIVASSPAFAAPAAAAPGAGPPAGGVVLFGGGAEHGFVGMDGGPLNWKVKDGTLISTANGRRSNHAISRRLFGDAALHVEFRLPPEGDGNSGVYIQGLYEVQILKADPDAQLGPHDLGAIYNVRPPAANAALPAGRWNSLYAEFHPPHRNDQGKITKPGRVTVWLNGKQVQDSTALNEPRSQYNPFRYGTTPHLQQIWKAYPHTRQGPLVLQDHDSPVEFRNVWAAPIGDRI